MAGKAAGGAQCLITTAILGQPLSVLLDPGSCERVRAALREERLYEVNPLQLTANGKRFDGIVHRHAGAAILELEPDLGVGPWPVIGEHHPFRSALLQIQRVGTLRELADVVVEQIRRVTGFERVMFYRFHHDGHGSVDAEAKDPALEPYLGLHYPASDIPVQARRLYLRNWLRLIFDARALPAPLVPTLRPDTGEPLDLSFSVLRSVSPVHLEYMKNMGTCSAMSISLIVRDRLWGLISCVNHSRPWRVPYEMRVTCESLGRLVSLEIAGLEDAALLSQRAADRATAAALGGVMQKSDEAEDALAALFSCPTELMGLVAAEGAALVSGANVVTCGRTPPRALVKQIADWIDTKGEYRPFSTDSLGGLFPPARKTSAEASGLLTFALRGASPRRLMWFRPEIVRTVSWGGEPSKPEVESGEPLRPRHSFAAWKEEVKLHSRRWTESDLEAADELLRRAIEVDVERRLAGEHRAVQAREDLLAIVSHDLKNPLSSILLLTEMLSGESAGDNAASLRRTMDRLKRSAGHMKAMVDDLLELAKLDARNFALQLQPVDSQLLIDEALRVVAPLAQAKEVSLTVQSIDAASLEADPERLFRVLSNLLGNAIKFSPAGGTVSVRAECSGGELWISVIDHGPGIAAEALPHVFDRYWKAKSASKVGAGLGLYIAKGIVEAHGGRIWAECAAGSTTFTFTVPLTGAEVAHRTSAQ